ncbi:MAG: hypothetical protein ACLQOO_11040 [Terriglobia bacterium]
MGGLQIQSVSGYAVYYSNFLPNGGATPQTASANLPSDVGGGGSIVFDWTKFTDRSSFSLNYTPSYTGYVRNSSLNALNHALSLTASRKIAPRWTFGFSVAGNLSTMEESLFSPTALSNVASVPSTFADLAAGVLSANFANNPQLGAVLTSSPLVESPISNLLYGQRMLTASAHVSLSYSYSPRLSVTFSGGGARTQHVEDQDLGAGNTAVIPNTTSGNAGVSISYSLSPLTQLGASATATRTSSSLYDGYTTTSQATLGRTLGARWFMQIHGGVGVTNAVGQTSSVVVPTKPGPLIGGSLGYKTFRHTFLGSYDRTVVDSYGLGASTTSSATGTWRWGHPGANSWWLDSSFTWQQLQGGALANTSGWRATVGLSRAVGPHVVLLTQYVHMDYSGGLLAAASHLSQDAVRVSIAWTPRPAPLQ